MASQGVAALADDGSNSGPDHRPTCPRLQNPQKVGHPRSDFPAVQAGVGHPPTTL